MSDETAVPPTGEVGSPPATGPVPTEGATAPVESPSGSVPADEELAELEAQLEGDPRKDVFLKRVKGQGAQIASLKEQLAHFQDYTDLVAQLRDGGWTPQDVAERLSAAAAEQQGTAQPQQMQGHYDPATGQISPGFAEYLREKRLDPDSFQYADEERQAIHLELYENRLEREENLRRSIAAEVQTQMQGVQQQFPVFQHPQLAKELYKSYAVDNDAAIRQGRHWTMMDSAKTLAGVIQEIVGQERARYAQGKADDASVPVTAGGASPSPQPKPDYATMSRQDRVAAMIAQLEAAERAGQL